MDTIVKDSIKTTPGGLVTLIMRNSKTEVEYKVCFTTDQFRKQSLKEEILALVGKVLWNQEIEKRIEELADISWREGQESTFDD